MHKTTIIAALAGVALIFTGCGVPASETGDAGEGSNVPAAAESSAADGQATEPAGDRSSADQDAVARFGSAYTYTDGLSVTVSAPKAFTPSEYAADEGKYDNYVKFEVRIVNKTGKTMDPSMFTATVQSDNEEGDEVYDSEGGLEGAPSTKLLNGRESKFTVGYGIANPEDIVMEVNPDFDHEPVMFQN
jgi:hypothetical protein